MQKPVQSNAEEGFVLARVRSEAVFARNAANVARKNSLVLMSWAGQGRSSLNSLASNVLRYSAFIGHIEYSAKGGGVVRARKKERKREKVRA